MKFLRIAAIAFLTFAAQCALAATFDQRSPFVQGNWWNPERSGSGLEIFNSGDQTMVIWYTYDDAGKPVWYTAQGATSTIGTAGWDLQKHRWANGRKADPQSVGWLRLTFKNVQSADVDFNINGTTGKWTIQPFVATAMIGDLDHSGSWFDPTNNGWGLTVIQQAEVLGGALFTYDASGNPTWVSGFERGTNSIEYFLYSGTCPLCPYKPFTTQSVGRLTFDFRDEYHANVKGSLSLAMAPGVKVTGANIMQFSRPMSFRSADRELANFADDASLKAFLVEGVVNSMPTYAQSGFSAQQPSPGVAYSTTNLQESGVDEADVVKNTANAIYSYAYDANGNRLPQLRVVSIDGLGLSMGPVSTVPLVQGAQSGGSGLLFAGLYVHDRSLVSITGTMPVLANGYNPWGMIGAWFSTSTMVEILDATNPTAPQSKWYAQIDGAVISSRRIGNRLYLITRWSPTPPFSAGFTYNAPVGSTYEAANRTLVAQMPVTDLLPKVRVNGAGPLRAVDAASVFVPPQGVRRRSADTTLITAIDLQKREIAQGLAIAGNAENIYVSQDNLYLMTSRYELRSPYYGTRATFDPYGAATDIHQIRLTETGMTMVASGSVDGFVGIDQERAPFQLSEHGGKLRVVSQSNASWGVSSRNRVTILEPAVTTAGTVLKSVSYIPSMFQPDPIGKPGEFLYSTRFVGDRLYAVTFKNIDPLYVVDLSNASAPRVAGALEMPGFATYLHPLENGLLLGFGKEAIPTTTSGDGNFAWYQGLMLALYDVSNPAAPREIQRAALGKRGSDSIALRDHHAFTTLKVNNSTIVTFPARVNDGAANSSPSYFYPWSYSGAIRYEIRGNTPQTAQIVGLQDLVTSSLPPSSVPPPFAPANDAVTTNGRAIVYTNSTIYVGNGQFWRMDAFGKSSGPF